MWRATALCLLVSLLATDYTAASVEELRQEPQDVSRSLKRLDAGTPKLQALTTTGVGHWEHGGQPELYSWGSEGLLRLHA